MMQLLHPDIMKVMPRQKELVAAVEGTAPRLGNMPSDPLKRSQELLSRYCALKHVSSKANQRGYLFELAIVDALLREGVSASRMFSGVKHRRRNVDIDLIVLEKPPHEEFDALVRRVHQKLGQRTLEAVGS